MMVMSPYRYNGGACGVVCGETWHAENPPCVRSKRLRVYGCRYTRRRPDRTHGGVLNVHTGRFSLLSLLLSLSLSLLLSLVLSFLFSSLVLSLFFLHVSFSFFLLFSLFSFIFSFIFSFCTHRDEIRQTRDSAN